MKAVSGTERKDLVVLSITNILKRNTLLHSQCNGSIYSYLLNCKPSDNDICSLRRAITHKHIYKKYINQQKKKKEGGIFQLLFSFLFSISNHQFIQHVFNTPEKKTRNPFSQTKSEPILERDIRFCTKRNQQSFAKQREFARRRKIHQQKQRAIYGDQTTILWVLSIQKLSTTWWRVILFIYWLRRVYKE